MKVVYKRGLAIALVIAMFISSLAITPLQQTVNAAKNANAGESAVSLTSMAPDELEKKLTNLATQVLGTTGNKIIEAAASYLSSVSSSAGAIFSIFGISTEDEPSISDVLNQLDEMKGQLDQISVDIKNLESKMDQGFDQISSQIENTQYQEKIKVVDQYYAQYKSAWNAYQGCVGEFEKDVAEAEQQQANTPVVQSAAATGDNVTSSDPATEENTVSSDQATGESATNATVQAAPAPATQELDNNRYILETMDTFIAKLPGTTTQDKINNINMTMNHLETIISVSAHGGALAEKTVMSTGIQVLRDYYPLEHQIRDDAEVLLAYCTNLYSELFLLQKEATVYQYYQKHIGSGSWQDVVIPDNLLTADTEDYLNNMLTICESSGVAQIMVTEDNKPDESSYYEGEVRPLQFESTFTTTGGAQYPAYQVRDNKTLEYYMVAYPGTTANQLFYEETFSVQTQHGVGKETETVVTDYKSSLYEDMLAGSSDGQYQMVNNLSEVSFTKNCNTNDLLGWMRSNDTTRGAGMDAIGGDTGLILLDNSAYNHYEKDNIIRYTEDFDYHMINQTFAVARDYNKTNPNLKTYASNDILSGGANNTFPDMGNRTIKDTKCMMIYKQREGLPKANYVPTDYSQVQNKTYVIRDGQTLDLSKINSTDLNMHIYVNGKATIIGNPNATYSNMYIELDDGANLTTTNLNLKGYNRQDVIRAARPNTTLNVTGTNTFSSQVNNSSDDIANIMGTSAYAAGNQMAGLRVDNTNVTVTGSSATFHGANGGAGIYVPEGKSVLIQNATVTANGSSGYNSGDINGTYGAGIGGVSAINHVFAGYDNYELYEDNRYTDVVANDASTHTGKIDIVQSNVTATNGSSIYGACIGTQRFIVNNQTNTFAGGSIKDSTINAVNIDVDPKFNIVSSTINRQWETLDLSAGSIIVTNLGGGVAEIKQNGNTYKTPSNHVYTITQSTPETSNYIEFAGGNIYDQCKLNIKGINIVRNGSPIYIGENTNVQLKFFGNNNLRATNNAAGLHVGESSGNVELIGDGTLTVRSDGYGAGIGGDGCNNSGKENHGQGTGHICIRDNLTVNASSANGAGIGAGSAKSGCNNYGGSLSLNSLNILGNAKVNATGGYLSPGVGGGAAESTSFSSYGGNGFSVVEVRDQAELRAVGGAGAVGIGGGSVRSPKLNVACPGGSGTLSISQSGKVTTTSYGTGKIDRGRDWKADWKNTSYHEPVIKDNGTLNYI